MLVGFEAGDEKRILLYFNISSLPSDIEITNAYVELFTYANTISAGKKVESHIHEITKYWWMSLPHPWEEG